MRLRERAAAPIERIDDWLARMRASPRRRRGATAVAVAVGCGAAAVSWLGLFLLGGLVGLTRRTLPRAIVAGVVAGAGAIGVTAALAPVSPTLVLSTFAPISYLPLAFGAAPVVGALVRGVF